MFSRSSLSPFIIFIAVAKYSAYEKKNSRVILPIRQTGQDVGLSITADRDFSFAHYTKLGEVIQADFPHRVWIYLADLPTDGGTIDTAIAALRAAGMPSSAPMFVSGHGEGGVRVVEEVRNRSRAEVVGTITFCACLSPAYLGAHPTPILTAIGDLDGINRLPSAARQFMKLEELLNTDEEAKYRYPVAVLSGVNHALMTSGTLPDWVLQNDLDPEVTAERSRQMVAQAALTFVNNILPAEPAEEVRARRMLDRFFYESKRHLQAMMDALRVEGSLSSGSSPWVPEAQRIIFNLPQELDDQFSAKNTAIRTIWHMTIYHPKILVNGSDVNVTTYVTIRYHENQTETTAFELAAKMKSHEAIMETLGVPAPPERKIPVECRQVNRVAWEGVYQQLPHRVRLRYDQRRVDVRFLPDDEAHWGPGWIFANLKFDFTDGVLEIQSTFLYTPTWMTEPKDWGGVHYCKLLSPARAAEFMYVDALKKQ